MAFADWFLSRSEAFKLLMMKFRDHKQDTVEAFSKVKRKHLEHDRRLDEHAEKIKQVEELMKLVHEKAGLEIRPKVVIKSAIVKKAGRR